MRQPIPKLSRVLLAVVLALLLIGSSAPWTGVPTRSAPLRLTAAECASGSPPAPASRLVNGVLDRLGVGRVPITYVVVVDTSSSMVGSRFAQVRSAMSRFFPALGPADRVAVVTFAGSADAAPIGDRDQAAQRIAQLREPNGDRTDIGSGIAEAIGELQDVPPGQPAVVVLLSDGELNAVPGSPYEQAGNDAWRKLAETAAQLRESRSVDAYAIPLDDADGVDLLCSVFPGATRLSVPSSSASLTDYLQRAQTSARITVADTLLRDDRGRAVTATWHLPPTVDVDRRSVTAQLTLHNTAPHLPVVLDSFAVAADGDLGTVTNNLPPRIELGPGDERTVDVELRWATPDSTSWSPFTTRGRYTTAVALTCRVSSPLADELTTLHLPGGPVNVAPDCAAPGQLVGDGSVRWNPAPLTAAVLLLVLAMVLAARLVPSLPGRLELYRKKDQEGEEANDRLVKRFDLNRRILVEPLARVDPARPESRLQVRARGVGRLRSTRKELCVRLTLPELRRSETRLIPPGERRIILGIDVWHRTPNQPDPEARVTAAYTDDA